MSETKWTPGPWVAEEGQASWWVVSDAGEVCEVIPWSQDCDRADAHLIAAAPELCDALDEMVAMSALLPAKIVRLNRQYVDPKEAVARARAALAKARGETS